MHWQPMPNNLIKVWSKVKFKEGLNHAEREIFPQFLEIAKSSQKILEVGAGTGRMIKILRANGVQASFCALDITENVKNSQGHRIIGDARYLPFKDNSFDLVYSLGVVEHFPETLKAIKEQSRVVKKDGKILLTVPHFGLHAIFRWIYYFKSGGYKQASYEVVKGRNMHLKEVRSYFQQSGLQILELRPVGPVVWLTPTLKINKVVEKILPSRRFCSFLFGLAEKG